MGRIVLAKTALDGHWRGLNTVARALREAGHEVVLVGMARADEIAAATVDEDADLVGLNVGGRVEVVERILDALDEAVPDVPVFAGGTVAPWAARRLGTRGVEVFPPGSSLADITAAAARLVDGDGRRAAADRAATDGAGSDQRATPVDGDAGGAADGGAADGAAGDGGAVADVGAAGGPPPQDRTGRLLDAAATLFHEQGYGHVGMRAIAEAAGVTTGSLYHHFDGKQDLLERICLGMTATFVDGHLPLLATDDPAPERLRTLIRQHVIFFWDRRVWLSVAFRELRHLDDDRRARVTAHRRRYQDAIRDVVAAGIDDGTFTVDDPDLATLALLDAVNGINDWFRPGGRLDIAELADWYATTLVDRLLAAPTDT